MPSRWQNVAREHAVGVEPGASRRGLARVEPLDVDAEAALQRDVALEGLDARRRREQEQVAVLMEVDRRGRLRRRSARAAPIDSIDSRMFASFEN